MQVLHSINILLGLILLWIIIMSDDSYVYEQYAIVGVDLDPEEAFEAFVLKPIRSFVMLIIGYGIYTFCAFFIAFRLCKQVQWRWIGAVVSVLGIFFCLCGFLLYRANLSWKTNGFIGVSNFEFILQPLFVCSIILSAIALVKLSFVKEFPQTSNDILDDPNSITHHES